MKVSLTVALVLLESVVAGGGFGDDEALVKANSKSSFLLHLISLK